jgi:prophage regulatory protein
MNQLPEIGFLRIRDIIGDRAKGIPALIPVSRSTFWLRVRTGVYPKGVLLGPNTRAWPVDQIRTLIADTSSEAAQ